MEQYIKSYREKGYPGLIQVLQIRAGAQTWLYNASKTLLEDLEDHRIDRPKHITISQYLDKERGLDIVELECDPQNQKTAIQEPKTVAARGERGLPYYKVIREYIGKADLFSCGVCMVLENEAGKIAIAKRSDTGEWSLPAGSRELGESLEHTVHAEAQEELGISLSQLKLLAIQSGSAFSFAYPNGHQVSFVSFLYYAKHKGGLLKVNDSENTEVLWADDLELRSRLSPRYLQRYQVYKTYTDQLILN